MIPRRDAKPLEYAALLPMFGGMEKKPRYIDRDVVTMGRARGSDFCLDGNEVSALHCLIYRAPDGYRVRDCGSRTGTRVNGQSCKTGVLGNGDVLQIGPFSFEVRIPRTFKPEVIADPHKMERLQRSRRHLARAALKVRRKYRDLKATSSPVPPGLEKSQADLKAKIKQFDQRVNELELSEQELLQEREDLDKLRREFQRQVHIKETEISERRKGLEVEFQERWEAVRQEVATLKRSSHPGTAPANGESLDKRQQELDALAERLRKKDADLNSESFELQKERDELEKAKIELAEQQIRAQQLFESCGQSDSPSIDLDSDAREARDAEANDLVIQKAQLAAMMEEVKHLQEELRGQGNDGKVEALNRQVDELTRQLDEARAQRYDEQQIRQIMNEVEQLQRQNVELREQAIPAAGPSPDILGEMEQLRTENHNLLQLAQEMQREFGTGRGSNDEAIASLKRENESLRTHLVAAESSSLDGRATELARENEELRNHIQAMESKLETLNQTIVEGPSSGCGSDNGFQLGEKHDNGAAAADRELLDNEIRLLKELLDEKESTIRELETAVEKASESGTEPESYEAELNQFRKELEADRAQLSEELSSIRIRNEELDDATREMEMQMSKERAEMARERMRLDRLRDEIKVDMDRLQREQEVRGSLGAVNKLRDELKNSSNGGSANGGKGAPVNDRLRSIRKV